MLWVRLITGTAGMLTVGVLTLYGWGVIGKYTAMSGTIAEQRQSIKSMTSRLEGAHMRINRRDDAIAAVGGTCAEKVKRYIKEGPPAPFDPFNESGRT
jgi:hypothetical protein